MDKDIALKKAIDALDFKGVRESEPYWEMMNKAIQACKEALAKPAQEPEVFSESDLDMFQDNAERYNLTTAHPAPLQNEFAKTKSWQGLTAKEIASIPLNEYTVQTVERMLKEKNLG